MFIYTTSTYTTYVLIIINIKFKHEQKYLKNIVPTFALPSLERPVNIILLCLKNIPISTSIIMKFAPLIILVFFLIVYFTFVACRPIGPSKQNILLNTYLADVIMKSNSQDR